jgi:hypothetical protein
MDKLTAAMAALFGATALVISLYFGVPVAFTILIAVAAIFVGAAFQKILDVIITALCGTLVAY